MHCILSATPITGASAYILVLYVVTLGTLGIQVKNSWESHSLIRCVFLLHEAIAVCQDVPYLFAYRLNISLMVWIILMEETLLRNKTIIDTNVFGSLVSMSFWACPSPLP